MRHKHLQTPQSDLPFYSPCHVPSRLYHACSTPPGSRFFFQADHSFVPLDQRTTVWSTHATLRGNSRFRYTKSFRRFQRHILYGFTQIGTRKCLNNQHRKLFCTYFIYKFHLYRVVEYESYNYIGKIYEKSMRKCIQKLQNIYFIESH